LGEGFSGPAVVGGRLFLQGQQGQQQYVLAYDVNTGKQLWKTPTGKSFSEEHGNGPRGTTTVDGSRLYAISTDGTLVCLEIATGKVVWSLNFTAKLGGRMPRWAYSESPLVDGERLIVTPGGMGASVVALNKNTGDPIWKSQNDQPGYSSPIVFDVGGAHIVTTLTGESALGLDAASGALLWRFPSAANRTANISTPIFRDGCVFYSSDYGTGCLLIKVAADGKSATEVYRNRDMENHYTTSMLIGDYLYGFSGNQSGILTAMEFKTGKVAWKHRSVGKGNCIFADGKLYCMGEDGLVGLIDPTPAAYKEISRFEIPRGNYNTWTPPVISNGKMYLREQDNLYCYNVKQ
jgi:outer membrane protein assembly factor BamB